MPCLGKWGYKDYCTSSINITDGSQPLNIILQSGYLDRFNIDQGWMAETHHLDWREQNQP